MRKVFMMLVLFWVPFAMQALTKSHDAELNDAMRVGTRAEDLQSTFMLKYGDQTLDLHETQFANEYVCTLDSYSGGTLYVEEQQNGVGINTYGIETGSGSTFIQPEKDYTLTTGGWNFYFFDGYPQSQVFDIFIVVRKNDDNTLTLRISPQGSYTSPSYALVGDFNNWHLEDAQPFSLETDNEEMEVYCLSALSGFQGEFKIVTWNAYVDDGNGSFTWNNALGDGGRNMVATSYDEEGLIRYNLYYSDDGQNNGITPNMMVVNPTLWLTIPKNGAQPNLFIQGTMSTMTISSLKVVGEFCDWDLENACQMSQSDTNIFEVDITDFPGGEDFRFSINDTRNCFWASDPTEVGLNIPCYCERGNDGNNFTVGKYGKSYNVHIRLELAEDQMSANVTITADPMEVKLVKNGWASFAADEDMSFAKAMVEGNTPVSVTAYAVTERKGHSVELKEIEGGEYRAGEGILIHGDSSMEGMTIIVPLQKYQGAADATYTDNKLVGLLEDTLVPGGPTVYRFGYSPAADRVGFMQSNADFNLSAGKAYLRLDDAGANFIPLFDATRIEGLSTDKPDTTAPMYNTAGQRVDSSYHGLVLQNGKKFILK